jgi:hypothetical protein
VRWAAGAEDTLSKPVRVSRPATPEAAEYARLVEEWMKDPSYAKACTQKVDISKLPRYRSLGELLAAGAARVGRTVPEKSTPSQRCVVIEVAPWTLKWKLRERVLDGLPRFGDEALHRFGHDTRRCALLADTHPPASRTPLWIPGDRRVTKATRGVGDSWFLLLEWVEETGHAAPD